MKPGQPTSYDAVTGADKAAMQVPVVVFNMFVAPPMAAAKSCSGAPLRRCGRTRPTDQILSFWRAQVDCFSVCLSALNFCPRSCESHKKQRERPIFDWSRRQFGNNFCWVPPDNKLTHFRWLARRACCRTRARCGCWHRTMAPRRRIEPTTARACTCSSSSSSAAAPLRNRV